LSMASKSIVEKTGSAVIRQVKPIVSTSAEQARRRVLQSYKDWMRHFPIFIYRYKLPYTDTEIKLALKQQFLKNAHVQDIRVIDRLVQQSEVELQGIAETWTPTYTVQNVFWGEHIEPKPKDFLSKFLAGKD